MEEKPPMIKPIRVQGSALVILKLSVFFFILIQDIDKIISDVNKAIIIIYIIKVKLVFLILGRNLQFYFYLLFL